MVSGYLLDTNVLSELRKRELCNAGVMKWFASTEEKSMFLSVLVLGEIRHGVELLRRRNATQAQQLDAWLHRISAQFAHHILPVDGAIADLWGSLGLEQPIPPIDGLLAATALYHGLTLVTRNASDTERTGVDVLNPFSG